MADVVAAQIVKTLSEDPTLARIEGRVVEAFFSDLPDDARYPCVVFSRLAPGPRDHYAPVESFQLLLEGLSDKSRDEAWIVWSAADALLDNVYATASGQGFRFRRATSVVKATDTTGRAVYRVLATYNVKIVG